MIAVLATPFRSRLSSFCLQFWHAASLTQGLEHRFETCDELIEALRTKKSALRGARSIGDRSLVDGFSESGWP